MTILPCLEYFVFIGPEVVTVDDVDAEKRVGNSLVQIWKLKFGHTPRFWFRRDFEVGVWLRFEVESWSSF